MSRVTVQFGLNADLLDDKHASAFASAAHVHDGGVGGGGSAVAHSDLSGVTADQHHTHVTVGSGGLSTKLSITAGQVLTLSAINHSDLSNIGASDHHAPITLDTNANTILSLSTQALGLDTQTANYGLFGPATGDPAVPTFRAALVADLPTTLLLTDGTRPLTAAWDAGSFEIRAQTFQSDVTTGTAPLTIASTTKVNNLNVDQVDSLDAQTLTATSPITLSGTTSVLAAGAITIAHATTAGNIHLPTGGSSNQILKNSGTAGTGAWGTVTENAGALAAITTATFSTALIGPAWKPASDSTTALQLQTSGGAAIVNVDTTNGRFEIGATGLGHTLGVSFSDTAAPNTATLLIQRVHGATAASPLITALFRNTGDTAGGSDYQNEVHLRLQAGTTANHRRYLNFCGYDGADDWLTGVNASDTWILFDANTPVHRFWFENSITGDGSTNIQSSGTGAVIINGLDDSTNNGGTGGLILKSGGAARSTFLTAVGGNFALGYGSVINTRYTATIYGTYTETSGASQGGLFLQPTSNPASASTAGLIGIYANPYTDGSYAPSYIAGMQTVASHYAAATLTLMYGGNFSAQNAVAQTVTTAYAGSFSITNSHASGIIGTAVGVYVPSPVNSGTINGYYGVRVLDAAAVNFTMGIRSEISAASTKHNLYISGTAKNYIEGNLGIGIITASTKFHTLLTDAGTSAIVNVVTIGHDTSGTAADGFGGGINMLLESSTTAAQNAARIAWLWGTATHASRTADLVAYVSDSGGEREGWRIRATGTAPAVGLYGATPVVRATTAGSAATFAQNSGNAVNDASTFDGYTLGQVVLALRNIGVLT